MIFNSYQKNLIKRNKRNTLLIKRKNTPLIIKNNFNKNINKFQFQSTVLPIKLPLNKYFNSFSQQTNKSSYINYTFLNRNEAGNYKSKTARESLDYMAKNNKRNKKPKIVNDYLKLLKKQSSLNTLNSSSLNNDLNNNKYYTERTHYYYNHHNKENKSNINNSNNFFMKKFNQLMDDINFRKEDDNQDISEIKKEDNYEELRFGKLNSIKSHFKLRKNLSIPIGKRIKMLKEVKNSINEMQKNVIKIF